VKGDVFHAADESNENKISHCWRGCGLLDSQLSSKNTQLRLVQEPSVGCIFLLDALVNKHVELSDVSNLFIPEPHPVEARLKADDHMARSPGTGHSLPTCPTYLY
jgi:hypothetical protein